MGAFEEQVRDKILEEIRAERERQIDEMGYDGQQDLLKSPEDWITLIMIYLAKAAGAPMYGEPREIWDKRLVQVAALCIAAIEAAAENDWG